MLLFTALDRNIVNISNRKQGFNINVDNDGNIIVFEEGRQIVSVVYKSLIHVNI